MANTACTNWTRRGTTWKRRCGPYTANVRKWRTGYRVEVTHETRGGVYGEIVKGRNAGPAKAAATNAIRRHQAAKAAGKPWRTRLIPARPRRR